MRTRQRRHMILCQVETAVAVWKSIRVSQFFAPCLYHATISRFLRAFQQIQSLSGVLVAYHVPKYCLRLNAIAKSTSTSLADQNRVEQQSETVVPVLLVKHVDHTSTARQHYLSLAGTRGENHAVQPPRFSHALPCILPSSIHRLSFRGQLAALKSNDNLHSGPHVLPRWIYDSHLFTRPRAHQPRTMRLLLRRSYR